MSYGPTTLYGVGDAVEGERIVVIASRISKPSVISPGGRHRAQRAKADDARAEIERAIRIIR